MSSRRAQLRVKDQPLDEIDALIRWALVDELAGEEPSPQVWQNIQAEVMARSRAMPSQSAVVRPWRQFASVLQAWTFGLASSLDTNWDSRLTPRERAYLVWRENLLLSMMPLATAITY